MTINTFVLSGEVQRVDVNSKPTKKGPAAVILLQYGPNRQRTEQAVEFVHVAVIRVPPYVYEKCKGQLQKGCLVDVTGHTQGVLKRVIGEGYVTNELVADRLQVVDAVTGEDMPQGESSESAESPAA
ncbi:hypothetical protein AB4Y45_35295 [Paraburkholderia sp. EG287A]|uniref:hypothetical protein n=1 Tax=Paraburkholderia sp. EG287A TaxID=3237012 RepID=UPI0034D303A6